LANAGIFSDENEAVAKHARRKNRHRDEVGFVPRSVVNQFAERHLGNIVLPLEHAREHPRHIFSLGDVEFKAGNTFVSAQDRQRSVIGAARETNFYGRSHSSFAA
jgi:hypothetical protein